MTTVGRPPDNSLSAWQRCFPNRRLRAGRLRLWRVELPVRPAKSSVLIEWVQKATSARRLGLPDPVVAALQAITRCEFMFLDLPTGPRPVSLVTGRFEPWAGETGPVPPAVLQPPGVEVVPITDDWRTVPVVRAEAVDVVAVWVDDRIDVYAAADPDGPALWQLPPDALPAANQ